MTGIQDILSGNKFSRIHKAYIVDFSADDNLHIPLKSLLAIPCRVGSFYYSFFIL
jgi:hypothetical protein